MRLPMVPLAPKRAIVVDMGVSQLWLRPAASIQVRGAGCRFPSADLPTSSTLGPGSGHFGVGKGPAMVKKRQEGAGTEQTPVPEIREVAFSAPAGRPAGVEVLTLAALRERADACRLSTPHRPGFHHL